ncbi:MAG TPA: class I SAM-dependent methyltransferase [Candidatus Margulisiibacteriota bacterium]|nr:class I SAM-dependent methyltransferase [Candidatus Margulisiibacteriota bacterium]
MSPPTLDRALLRELFRFNARLGLYRLVKGMDYVRCIEFPTFAAELLRWRAQPLAYLDVGSGDSVLPTFVATHSAYRVTVVDKFEWVEAQARYLQRLGRSSSLSDGRFTIRQEDFVTATSLPPSTFDLITALSVVEHMDGDGDTQAVRKIFALLKPGGRFLMSSPYNDRHAQDFFVPYAVYGARPDGRGAFFQRHYSAETLRQRIIEAAPFEVERIFYAGHYERLNFFKRFWLVPGWLKPLKLFYNWAAPFYAPHFLQLSATPPADPQPQMVTADTAFVFLRKP